MRKLSKQYFEVVQSSRFVEISPRIYAQMASEKASAAERQAIKLIEDKWCEGEGDSDELTLEIISLGGWSGPEMMITLDLVAARQRATTISSGALIESIATTKGITIQEAAALASRVEQEGMIDELLDFLPMIADSNQRQEAIDPTMLRETALIKRTIPAWNNELTLALHQDIRLALGELAQLEDAGGFELAPKELSPVAEVEPEASPLTSYDVLSTASEITPLLIGAA
jgi:hypothetical protein